MRPRNRHSPDYVLIGTILFVVAFGLLMVFSSSIVSSYEAAGSNTYFFWRQVMAAGVGLVGFFVAQKIDYHFWKKLARIAWWISLVLLVLVLIPGIGTTAGSAANRWIDLGFITIQPSQVLLFSAIVFFAAWFDERSRDVSNFAKTVLPFLGYLAIIGTLLMLEPDLGTLVVVAAVLLTQYLVAGANFSHFVGLGLLGSSAFALLSYFEPYRLQRLMVFLNPSQDALGAGYQINQALLALGSGGILGLGYGHSRQKYNYLPEASSDSIFAIIGEELGLIGAIGVLFLYWVIVSRGINIARSAPDNFGRILAAGIIAWIGIQAIVNIGAMLGMLPLTGITLPLISQGGTSLAAMLTALGILVNISKQTTDEYKSFSLSRWWNSWSRYTNIGRSLRGKGD